MRRFVFLLLSLIAGINEAFPDSSRNQFQTGDDCLRAGERDQECAKFEQAQAKKYHLKSSKLTGKLAYGDSQWKFSSSQNLPNNRP